MHTSTTCMHMSATLLPLQQCICSALPPPDSSRSSLLPPQLQVLCTAAHRRTTSSRRHAAPKNPIRARAPPYAGSSRHLEPCLPSLPILLEEARPLTATKCCARQVAHGWQPWHRKGSTDCVLSFLAVPCDGLGPPPASSPAAATRYPFPAEEASREGGLAVVRLGLSPRAGLGLPKT